MVLIKKYDQELIRCMNLFEQVCRVSPKDCFSIEDTIFFTTTPGTTRSAIGPQGVNAKKMSELLKKEVKILEWVDSPEGLVRSYLFPANIVSVSSTPEKNIEILLKSSMSRRYLLSDRQVRLKQLVALIKHYFPETKDLRVL